MGLRDWIFGKRAAKPAGNAEGVSEPETHQVSLHIPLRGEMPSDEEFAACVQLEDEIEAAVVAAGAGALDGHEWGGSLCVIFFYGPDADRLFDAMIPVLEKRPFPKGSFALKRDGASESSREERVNLEWDG
jgi:hypothetical protein